MSSPPPPPALTPDNSAAADPARARFQSKSFFSRLFPRKHRPLNVSVASLNRVHPSTSSPELSPLPSNTVAERSNIHLDASRLRPEDEEKDHYQWAILYENQRGMTIFSIPYYSHMSLLPHDPSPFTVPNTSSHRSKQPALTLTNYPLPDGTWRWVSRSWMIDMRSDGEVQHDGFQYNWLFRQHNWRAQAGPLSAGGWVRRRRWVRLMMRPAKTRPDEWDDIMSTQASSTSGKDSNLKSRHSVASSFPASTLSSPSSELELHEVWTGQDAAADWQRCRRALRKCGRDSRKLELWKAWLGYYHPEHKHKFFESDLKGKRAEKQWTEDDASPPFDHLNVETDTLRSRNDTVAPVPTDYILPILHHYGSDILDSFIYPDSRAKFLKLLSLAGLLPELNVGLGIGPGATEVDFWSYVSELGKKVGVAEASDIVKTKSNSALKLLTK